MLVYLLHQSPHLRVRRLHRPSSTLRSRRSCTDRRHASTVGKSICRRWGNVIVAQQKESLQCMAKVLSDDDIPDDSGVAIEYMIPPTAKRIDFILTGRDQDDRPHVVIVELKQWSSAHRTEKDAVVRTRFAQGESEVSHPSYQAWSYAALLEGFNEAVYDGGLKLKPCAYLHNYISDNVIDHAFYRHHIEKAPLFLKGEAERLKLRNFIKRFVKFGDDRDVIYLIENGRIRPSKMLVDSLVRMIQGKQEFILVDDQKVVYENAVDVAMKASESDKQVLIVSGGPGTGKSVVAINLLVTLTKLGKVCRYVSKNAAPRSVYESKLTGVLRKTEISNLFSGSGAFTEAEENCFDVLIVDEAHRLNEKSGLYGNLGDNQIKELISAAKCTILFVDDDQRVTLKDIGEKWVIEKWATELGAETKSMELSSQFRCNGADGYLAWLDNTLDLRPTANEKLDPTEFDFRVLDSPRDLHALIIEKNESNNRSRVVAGYCWKWVSKKQPKEYDIEIPEFRYRRRWNLSKDGSLWIIAAKSVEEVGCIHTSQGLEVDYIGVIIGPDFIVRNGEVVTRPEKRATSDKSLDGYKKLLASDPAHARQRAGEIIKNTYRTLMTRGMKGCFVYCTDPETAEYFRSRLLAAPPVHASLSGPADSGGRVLPFERVQERDVKPYINAIPLVDLKFAAGAFNSQTFDPTDAEWVEIPEGIRPQEGLFIAQVVGDSMNRRIPNGAWCLFRANPGGTRSGKVVVATHRNIHDPDLGGSYTVKVYSSEKASAGTDSWRHVSIQLKPDSTDPRFKPITFTGDQEGELRIVAELLAVLV
ncbi:MAG: DUF2075 domain-containing protein [Deltaproteobacteria bacterium]|nr:DUF2075 domain-containing protein [Deltaproteobacteria bacterium]